MEQLPSGGAEHAARNSDDMNSVFFLIKPNPGMMLFELSFSGFLLIC